MNEQTVIQFWFEQLSPKDWWRKSKQIDQLITSKFKEIHEQVNAGKTVDWRKTDSGRLAEIIVLDQFSRNMFRGKPASFASDTLALVLSRAAIEVGALKQLDEIRASFVLMPFMHSESLSVHNEGLPLFKQYCGQGTVEFERRHHAIIERFGRYPHRNDILGRTSSAEEVEFLSQPGSSF